jgi:seryl-tRNA synthetase
MLDLKLLRREPDAVRASLVRRGDDPALLDSVLDLDARRREVLPALETLRAEQNAANDAIATAKREGTGADEAIAAMREVAGRAKALDEEVAAIDADLRTALAQLPNLAEPDAPAEDTPLREVGTPAARTSTSPGR